MLLRPLSLVLAMALSTSCGEQAQPFDAGFTAQTDASGRTDAAGPDHSAADANPSDTAATTDRQVGRDNSTTDRANPDATARPCPTTACTEITNLPYTDSDDTSTSPRDIFDSYSCGSQSESGPERVYQVTLNSAGTLVAMLDDGGDVGADIDIYLLDALQTSRCLARGHIGLSAHLSPGTYFLIADSFTGASGTEYPGPYSLYVHFLVDGSTCAMASSALSRIGASDDLPMPATGPVVKEAHLVTDQEFSGGSWPGTIDDAISAHYALSESATGYQMSRGEPWAPCCEPSNEYGQGSSARPPVEAEAFYVNMRWASAPPRGQRYILYNGKTGKAVVAAAGYENGPGDLSRIGGASEEIHDHLGTGHLDHFTFGLASDQSLSYGPIVCQE